jgi:hypothetical protein
LTLTSVACFHACWGPLVQGADTSAVKHPNLLLDRQEIEALKEKIRTQPWAAVLLEKLKAGVGGLDLDRHGGPRNAALLYAITGEKQYADRAAAMHVRFSPEEVHLSAGHEKEVNLTLRAVGEGRIQGRIRVEAPQGIVVQPTDIEVEPMGQGPVRTMSLKVRADKDAAKALHRIRFIADPGLRAEPAELLTSVGVVITEDRTVPMNSQWVVRAPGYTMKIDHTSCVPYCLLDGEGHRRHGRIRRTNFIHGIPAVEQDGHWASHFAMPCQFMWTGANDMTIGCGSLTADTGVRLRYTFHEDRIVIGVIPPTNPTKQQTLWLGNFDALRPPLHNGNQAAPHLPVVADRFFFPHPVYRQGILLRTPPETPLKFLDTAVNLPIRLGQEVSLQFVEESEAGLK